MIIAYSHIYRICVPVGLTILLVLFSAAQRGQPLREFDFNSRIHELESQLQSQLPENRRREALASLMDLYARQADIYEMMGQSAAAAAEVYFDVMKNSETGARAADYIFAGISAFERGEYDLAGKRINGVLERNQQLPEQLRDLARAWLGAVHYVSGEKQRAAELWKSVNSPAEECDETAYLRARLNATSDSDRCNRIPVENASDRQKKALIQLALAHARHSDLAAIVKGFTGRSPAYIDGDNIATKRVYYDPSVPYTLSRAYYALASETATKLAAGLPAAERARLRTNYYIVLYAYKANRYDDVIALLTGTDDMQSALILAAAFFKAGKIDQAEEIFRYLEREGDDAIRSEMGRMIAELRHGDFTSRAIRLCENSLRNAQSRTRRGIDQRLYRNLAHTYLLLGRYEEALEVFGEGYRSERRSDPAGNDPAFSIMFGAAIVQGKHFIALPDAIDMFATVMQMYPAAIHLVEVASLIDVTTNIGREGRLMYRR
jgi:tetratricopeptide (TPR) repeat protein